MLISVGRPNSVVNCGHYLPAIILAATISMFAIASSRALAQDMPLRLTQLSRGPQVCSAVSAGIGGDNGLGSIKGYGKSAAACARCADVPKLQARGVAFISAPHVIHRHADGKEDRMALCEDLEGRPLAIMAIVGSGSRPTHASAAATPG